jgi:hypothetical protein
VHPQDEWKWLARRRRPEDVEARVGTVAVALVEKRGDARRDGRYGAV